MARASSKRRRAPSLSPFLNRTPPSLLSWMARSVRAVSAGDGLMCLCVFCVVGVTGILKTVEVRWTVDETLRCSMSLWRVKVAGDNNKKCARLGERWEKIHFFNRAAK
jgi:hypothetical protein